MLVEPVIAGAIGASAIAFLLLTFGGCDQPPSPLPHEAAWRLCRSGIRVVVGEHGADRRFFAVATSPTHARANRRWARNSLRDSTHGFWFGRSACDDCVHGTGVGAPLRSKLHHSPSRRCRSGHDFGQGWVSTVDYAADMLTRRTGLVAPPDGGNESQRDEVKRSCQNIA